MKVAVVAHVGETVGHLVRGVTLARAIARRGSDTVLVAPAKAAGFVTKEVPDLSFRAIPWAFSHNDCHPRRPLPQFVASVVEANRALVSVLAEERPDAVVGFPGLVTTQAARFLGIPHFSVLHGPYLSPLVDPAPFPADSRRILSFATSFLMGGAVDAIFRALAGHLRFPALTYRQFLSTEPMYVPQPNLSLPELPNVRRAGFIRGSYGPDVTLSTDADDVCYVTFGSGNRSDITPIVHAASRAFGRVVVSGSESTVAARNVSAYPAVASLSLVPVVRAVVSHGGIGTVGTFAERGTPQLIIPTELDQATMAVHAVRSGVATALGLDSWRNRTTLGRRLPALDVDMVSAALERLSQTKRLAMTQPASGADEIADDLLGGALWTNSAIADQTDRRSYALYKSQ